MSGIAVDPARNQPSPLLAAVWKPLENAVSDNQPWLILMAVRASFGPGLASMLRKSAEAVGQGEPTQT